MLQYKIIVIPLMIFYIFFNVLNAQEYSKTSYYVAYDTADKTQFVLVMPSVQKAYTHRAGEIAAEDLKRVDNQFVWFPKYSRGELCFSKLKENALKENGAEVMAGKCYKVNFFYTQKETTPKGVVFILYYAPADKVYEGFAGDGLSFQVVKEGEEVYNKNSITEADYSHFTFDIGKGIVKGIVQQISEANSGDENGNGENGNDKNSTGNADDNYPDENGTDSGENEHADENSSALPDDTPPPVPLKQVGWYLRTVVKATLSDGRVFEHSTAGVFGELDDSEAGKDRHDIESFGKAILQIRFVNAEIDSQKEYYSDYRKYDGESKKEKWTFLVENEQEVNLANASLSISIEPMRSIFQEENSSRYIEKVAKSENDKRKDFVLVDVDNQKTYSYAELKNANLSMEGKHTRTFRWVLGSATEDDMKAEKGSRRNIRMKRSYPGENERVFTPKSIMGSSKFGMPPE